MLKSASARFRPSIREYWRSYRDWILGGLGIGLMLTAIVCWVSWQLMESSHALNSPTYQAVGRIYSVQPTGGRGLSVLVDLNGGVYDANYAGIAQLEAWRPGQRVLVRYQVGKSGLVFIRRLEPFTPTPAAFR